MIKKEKGNRNMIRKTIFAIVNILVPLIIGACIYIISRETYIYRFMTSIGMQEIQNEILIPKFIRNFGCDFLWAYALVFSMHLVTGLRSRIQIKIVMLEITVCLALEVSQLLPFSHSTFDPKDCLVEIAAIILANSFIYLIFRKGEKNYG